MYCLNQPASCLGGPGTNSREFCYTGMVGALCEECDLESKFWPEAYSNSGPFLQLTKLIIVLPLIVCDKCSNVDGNFSS